MEEKTAYLPGETCRRCLYWQHASKDASEPAGVSRSHSTTVVGRVEHETREGNLSSLKEIRQKIIKSELSVGGSGEYAR